MCHRSKCKICHSQNCVQTSYRRAVHEMRCIRGRLSLPKGEGRVRIDSCQQRLQASN